jgi:hypothetical protein
VPDDTDYGQDRATIAPRRADEVEQVEMGDWVSGWLAVGSMGDPIAGYARIDEGPWARSSLRLR